LGFVVKDENSEGGSGESVKSIEGEGDWILLNSAIASVKMVAVRVFISGPPGIQYSEHTLVAPLMGQA
jgi:hypothetical protein